MTKNDLRKNWLPITSVAAILGVLLPAAALWASDRSMLHGAAGDIEEMRPRIRILEQANAAQIANQEATLRLLESIDRRLERLEGR